MINRKIYFFLLFLPMITIHLFYIFFCQSTIHYYPWHLNFLTSKIEMMYNYDKLMFIVISVENNLFVGVILRLCNSLTLFRFILWCSSKAINKTPDYLDLNLVNATKLFPSVIFIIFIMENFKEYFNHVLNKMQSILLKCCMFSCYFCFK